MLKLYPAAMLKKDAIHFRCFDTGPMLMTSIKRSKQIQDVYMPVGDHPNPLSIVLSGQLISLFFLVLILVTFKNVDLDPIVFNLKTASISKLLKYC